MTNDESKQQYEGAILQQLIKNSEKLAIIELEMTQMKTQISKIGILEHKVDYIYNSLKWVFGLLGAILIAVVANLSSQPILSWLT